MISIESPLYHAKYTHTPLMSSFAITHAYFASGFATYSPQTFYSPPGVWVGGLIPSRHMPLIP